MSFVINSNQKENSQGLTGFPPPLSEMYSMNWIMFLPNVIIDAKLGCFWYMQLNLNESGDLKPFLEIENEHIKLTEFLLNRKNTKPHLLNACRNLIRGKSSLKLIEQVFAKINEFYKFSLLLSKKLSEGETGEADKSKLNQIKATVFPWYSYVTLYIDIYSRNKTLVLLVAINLAAVSNFSTRFYIPITSKLPGTKFKLNINFDLNS